MGGEQAARTMAIVAEAGMKRKGGAVDQAALDQMEAAIVERFDSQMSVFATSARLLDDGVIDPRDTRAVLATVLAICREGDARTPNPIQFSVARLEHAALVASTPRASRHVPADFRPAMTATPFSRVLVANRGEIALRVMRTARRMGLGTVAVYSSADAGAPHVRAADQAIAIGGAPPAESYLSIPALLEPRAGAVPTRCIRATAFLPRTPDSRAAAAPPASSSSVRRRTRSDAMGDKAAAKRLMQAAGVPCIPGCDDEGDEALLAERAAAIGYPVMIKARAGGGGRGMRRVAQPAEFGAALRSARSEAQAAFGDSRADPRAGPRRCAPHRGPGVRRPPRPCDPPRRARLLGPAPTPEADRGSAVAGRR